MDCPASVGSALVINRTYTGVSSVIPNASAFSRSAADAARGLRADCPQIWIESFPACRIYQPETGHCVVAFRGDGAGDGESSTIDSAARFSFAHAPKNKTDSRPGNMNVLFHNILHLA